MADFNEHDLSYLAGIIDGEGTIGITELKPRYKPGDRKQRRKSTSHKPYVAVVMCDETIPTWIKGNFGGYLYNYPGRKATHKSTWRWCMNNRPAAEFCSIVRPYLKLKKPQADLVVQFYEDERIVHTRRRSGIPEDELKVRHSFIEAIQKHNQRGILL